MVANYSIQIEKGLSADQRAARTDGVEIVQITRLVDVKRCGVLIVDYDDWVAAYLYDHGIVVDSVARTKEFLEQQAPELLAGGGRLYAAYRNGGPVGVLALTGIDENTVEVTRLFVCMTSRRRGIARALLERAVEDARSQGYRTLQIQVLSFMYVARDLCEAAGFSAKRQVDALTTLMERKW